MAYFAGCMGASPLQTNPNDELGATGGFPLQNNQNEQSKGLKGFPPAKDKKNHNPVLTCTARYCIF